MIAAKVRGFRGCEKADIDIPGIALLAGLNGAGKSSICQAVAAAACAQPIPFFNSARPDKPRFTKADGKALLRGGMEVGGARIEVDGAPVAEVTWPSMTASGNGSLQCSLIAAGLVNPMEMEEVERQRYFSQLLEAVPAEKDLRDSVVEAVPVLGEEDYADTLKDILTRVFGTDGWDVTHKHFKERGARRKGEWEGKAGESFGAKKATDWKPAGWTPDLDALTLEEIGSACTRAAEKVEKAVAGAAVEAATLESLAERSKHEGLCQSELEGAQAAVVLTETVLKTRQQELGDIVIPTATPCPHCGGLLDIAAGKGSISVKQSQATVATIAVAKQAYEAAVVAMQKAAEANTAAQNAYGVRKTAYDSVRGATAALETEKGKTGSQEAIAEARDFLRTVTSHKEMVEARDACATLAAQIQSNQKLIDILAPEGLRRQKLQKALTAFNKRVLGPLSAEAEYSTITIDDNLEVLYGGRRYFLLSASEQYRVRAVIQIAAAQYDKSALIIFDGADILDQEGRNGLFAMMSAANAHDYLVGMTVLKKTSVPDLYKLEIGRSYWVEEGIATELGSA